MNNFIPMIVNKSFLLLVMLMALNLGGCATIVSGTSQDIKISSTPVGADVKIQQMDNPEKPIVYTGKTPSSASLKRKNVYLVTISQDGFKPSEVPVAHDGSMNGWVWGNILFGGIIGSSIDLTNGAALSLSPDRISENLVKLPPKPLTPEPSGSPDGIKPEGSIETPANTPKPSSTSLMP